MATYYLSLAIDADNPIVAEWRHMLAHILGAGVAVTDFKMTADGLNLEITTTADLPETIEQHLQLTKV